jgi:hypothetical protein
VLDVNEESDLRFRWLLHTSSEFRYCALASSQRLSRMSRFVTSMPCNFSSTLMHSENRE